MNAEQSARRPTRDRSATRLQDLDEQLRLAFDATANRHVRLAMSITGELMEQAEQNERDLAEAEGVLRDRERQARAWQRRATGAEADRLRAELRDAHNDLLEVRGILSPNGGPRRVPPDVELVPTVAPAIWWLVNELDRLRGALVGSQYLSDVRRTRRQAARGQSRTPRPNP